MVNVGNIKIDNMFFDKEIKVDKNDGFNNCNSGELLRVKVDNPNAKKLIEDAAKGHKGTEVLVKEGNELVLYSSKVDFKSKDVKSNYAEEGQISTDAHQYTKIDGKTVVSPSTGKAEAVVSLFTDDNKEITVGRTENLVKRGWDALQGIDDADQVRVGNDKELNWEIKK